MIVCHLIFIFIWHFLYKIHLDRSLVLVKQESWHIAQKNYTYRLTNRFASRFNLPNPMWRYREESYCNKYSSLFNFIQDFFVSSLLFRGKESWSKFKEKKHVSIPICASNLLVVRVLIFFFAPYYFEWNLLITFISTVKVSIVIVLLWLRKALNFAHFWYFIN